MASLIPLVLWRIGREEYNAHKEAVSMASLERGLACLEQCLEGREWLVDGEKLSLADISVASALIVGFMLIVDGEMRGRYPGVVGWYERLIETEGVKEVFGGKILVDKCKSPPA